MDPIIVNPIPLKHNKRASAKEDIARNYLARALATCPIALDLFLKLFFRGNIPGGFRRRESLRIETDVRCNGSFADLVLYAGKSVLCIEVKIDAREHVGQYSKYKRFFEHQGFDTCIGGLIRNRAEAKNPFLAGVPRILWAELLDVFGEESRIIELLRAKLDKINPQLRTRTAGVVTSNKNGKSLEHLASDNAVLAHFFKDLIAKLSKSLEGEFFQAGNAPNSILVTSPQWRKCFAPGWYPRIALSLNKNTRAHAHIEPNFGFAVFLWHTDWCQNLDWFLLNRDRVLGHFAKRDFRIVRNIPRKWTRQFDWRPPYNGVESLKYVNSFPRFQLLESEYTAYTWGNATSALVAEINRITSVINRLKSELQ